MAGRWRIRHKLMLGLGLVVGVMALLLAGTVQGLVSYRRSGGMMESQVDELRRAQEFREAVVELARVEPPAGDAVTPSLKHRLLTARDRLAAYEVALAGTVDRGRYLKPPLWRIGIVRDLKTRFDRLLGLVDEHASDPRVGVGGPPPSLRETGPFKKPIDQTLQDADDLLDNIKGAHEGIEGIVAHANAESARSLWVLGTTSVVSVLLMAGMQRAFYRWVFNPVRDLMTGVARVAQGKFEHVIEVNSGDEMQDLAAAFNDMTARLREIYGDLERQVNERSRQLVRSERLASVGFLAAGVAHEINNPLASIAFCSEAVEARLAEGPRAAKEMEVVLKYLKMIQQEAFRCKEITQRLLEFSRSGEKRREPTDLGELVQAVLDVAQHLPNHKGKTILFDARTAVTAWVNAQEIKSVVLNLVVNALESLDEGGSLAVALRQRDGSAELTFRDNGCGMTDEVLDNIFEPFFTQSRSGKGTGLGLTISHRIVTGHGGDIEAASGGPGQGSTFTVRLPLTPAAGAGDGTENEENGSPEELFRRRQAA